MRKINAKRRLLICAKVVGLVVACLFQSISADAKNQAQCEIDARFGAKERRILQSACRLAVSRLQEKAVWEEVYRRSGFALLGDGVMSDANAANTARSRWFLLQRQISTLALPNGPNDSGPAFPDIRIDFDNKRENWLGKARVGLVSVFWDAETREWRQRGSFVITINDHYVASSDRYSDPNEWAGTVAHEMLHNLGHRHPDASDPTYRQYQINVLDDVVTNFGGDFKSALMSASVRSEKLPCGVD